MTSGDTCSTPAPHRAASDADLGRAAHEPVVRTLLEPRSVAVVGASNDLRKPGARVLRNIVTHGYEGEVFPVSQGSEIVQGLPTYTSVTALPRTPDVAIVAIPIAGAVAVTEECARRGVRAVVLISADPPGSDDHHDALARVRERYPGTRILGASSLGVHGGHARFAGNFGTATEGEFDFVPSDVFILSQSGGVGGYVLSAAHASGLKIGGYISTGREVDLTFAELLTKTVDEYAPRLVLGYLEGTQDLAAFSSALQYARQRDVVVVLLRGGVTGAGRSAARRHSGLEPFDDESWRAAVDGAGALTARSIEEMLDIARAAASRRCRKDARFSVVAASGGATVLMVDALAQEGFGLARWQDSDKAELRRLLPEQAVLDNPIDATGAIFSRRHTLRSVLEVCVRHEGTDAVILTLGNMPHLDEHVFAEISAIASEAGKLVVVVWAGGSPDAVRRLAGLGVLAFSDAARCAYALRRAADIGPA